MKGFMKKALSMMLAFALVFGVMSALGTVTVKAEDGAPKLKMGKLNEDENDIESVEYVPTMMYKISDNSWDKSTVTYTLGVVSGGTVTELTADDVKVYHYDCWDDEGAVDFSRKKDVTSEVISNGEDGTVIIKLIPGSWGTYRIEKKNDENLFCEFKVDRLWPYFTTNADGTALADEDLGTAFNSLTVGDYIYYVVVDEYSDINTINTQFDVVINGTEVNISAGSSKYLKICGDPVNSNGKHIYKFEVLYGDVEHAQFKAKTEIIRRDRTSYYCKYEDSINIGFPSDPDAEYFRCYDCYGGKSSEPQSTWRTNTCEMHYLMLGTVKNGEWKPLDLTEASLMTTIGVKVADAGKDGKLQVYCMNGGNEWIQYNGQKIYCEFIDDTASNPMKYCTSANGSGVVSPQNTELCTMDGWNFLAYKVGYSTTPQYSYVKVDDSVAKIVVDDRVNSKKIVLKGNKNENYGDDTTGEMTLAEYQEQYGDSYVSYANGIVKINTAATSSQSYFNTTVYGYWKNSENKNDGQTINIMGNTKPSSGSGNGGYTPEPTIPTDPTPAPEPEVPAEPVIENKTETKDDGTVVETEKITDVDGSTKETVTETKTDGTVVETVQEVAADGSTTESVKETAVDGSSVETVKEVAANGTTTDTVIETAVDGAVVETKTEVATDGSTTESIKEVAADGKSSASVEVKKDENGKVTDSVVAVESQVKGKKLTVDTATITEMIAKNDDATVKNTTVVLTANDTKGNEKYTVEVDAKDLKAGAKLQVYALDKNGNPVIVDQSKNNVKVTKSGDVQVKIDGTGDFTVVTPAEAKKIEKQIEKSVKPAKTSVAVEKGAKTTFKLDSGCNKDNITKITYTSSNSNVKVNKNGKITANGNATITATVTLANGKTKTIKMKVKAK